MITFSILIKEICNFGMPKVIFIREWVEKENICNTVTITH